MYFIVRWGVIKNKQKQKKSEKTITIKKDEGVKEGAYKSGCGLDIDILSNKLAQIKT